MFEWAHGIIDQMLTLIRAGIVVFAIITVSMIYARTKAVVPVAVAALLAGAVIWAVNNIDWFERKVGQETIALAPALAEPLLGADGLRFAAADGPGDERERAFHRA
ncbi:MAG: hypothetical protein WD250_15245 [Egibacteraceae bacterium]